MTIKSQEEFLKWAKTGKGQWPTVKCGRHHISSLDLAIQEGVASYVKWRDISPLRRFLETSAKFLLPNDAEKLKPPGPSKMASSPTELARARMVKALGEVYGFTGDFESAWRVCVQSGLDSDPHRYLTFGVHCDWRNSRRVRHTIFQFFALQSPMLGECIRLRFTRWWTRNLKNPKLKKEKTCSIIILASLRLLTGHALKRQIWETYSKPNGVDLFERGEFQKKILHDFRQRFEAALQLFEDRLRNVFAKSRRIHKIKAVRSRTAKDRTGLFSPAKT